MTRKANPVDLGLASAALVEASRAVAALRGDPRNGHIQELILRDFKDVMDIWLEGVDIG